MIRTRLASLALATGLGFFCGCLYIPERPWFPHLHGGACINGACETGCCNGGEGGCCNGGGMAGPVLDGMVGGGMPPPPPPPEAIAPVPAVPPQRLVPMPQSTPMPYVPS